MTKLDERISAWTAEFESLGETKVRLMDVGSQAVPDDKIIFSRVWLKEREDERRSLIEERTLSIARKALCSSYWANAIAIVAAIIAVMAIVLQK